MAKKKEEKKVVEEEKPQEEKKVVKKEEPQKKKVVKKEEPQEEKESVLKMVAENGLDTGLVAGALNSKGLYLQFMRGLTDVNNDLKMTKKEFMKIIDDFKNGEL